MTLASESPPVSMAWFEIALIIFMVVFVLIAIWTLICRGSHFRRAAQIPLDDAVVVTPRHVNPSSTDRPSASEDTHEQS